LSTQILVIDDDLSFLNLVKRKLNLTGITATLASSGSDVEDLLKNFAKDFDIVLLDQLMPDINGLEVFEKIKEVRPDIPVIMMTAHSSLALAVAFMKTGGFDYIEKPIDFEVLEVKIRQAMVVVQANREKNGLKMENVSMSEALSVLIGLIDEIRDPLNLITTEADIMVERGENSDAARKMRSSGEKISKKLDYIGKILAGRMNDG
jgi:DNA-binding NtrC family response regulator